MIEFLEEFEGTGDHLIVAFTGVLHRMGGIPFEFHRSLGEVDAKVLFVRDLEQRWYQYDLSEIDRLAGQIRGAAAAVGANRLSCIGNSMGGFGALMFGRLCAANATLAFAPQTTILPSQTMAMGDRRWVAYQEKIEAYSLPDLNVLSAPKGRVTIHHGEDDVLDAAHAERLNWDSHRVIHTGCGHNVAKALRERGELTTSIRNALFD